MSDRSGNTENECQLFKESDVETVDLVKYVHWLRDANNLCLPLIQLPPIQRGDVWKVAQVERLWDSVLRGFPIGSFLFAPLKAGEHAHGIDSTKQEHAARNGWFLLDGQQRTRALILGFPPKKQTACLWIDMAPQTSSMLDRAFLFRFCTEQRPWGMQHDPDRKIEDDDLRKARKQLREVHPEKAEDLDLRHDYGLSPEYTWPVHSTLPVPFADLVERVRQSGNACAVKWDDLLPKPKLDNLKKHQNGSEQSILEAISKMLARKVVLLKLDPAADPMLAVQDLKHTDAPDAMETLFERVNSGGTRLEGEEMMFSLLKAKWPDAYTLVQTIVDHGKVGFLLPSTGIVLSAARLARAQLTPSGNRGDYDDVAKPKVRQFRRWIAEGAVVDGEDGESDGPFLVQMKRFLKKQEESGEPRFVRIVLDFLEAARYREGDDIGLPRPLLLALDRYAIDVVLRWIDMRCEDHNFSDALAESRLPILRFLIHSLVAWIHPEKASRRAFSVLSREGNDRFPDIKIYERLIKEENGPSVALEMLCPRDVEKCVISDDRRGLRSHQELFPPEPHGRFVERFWNQRVLLLWFQRADLGRLFPGYDPLKMRSNSPFDYDHILPSRHLFSQGKSPTFEQNIDPQESRRFLDHRWLYCDSVGNYRIWPSWANRSDQDTSPDEKLGLKHLDEPIDIDEFRKLGYERWSEIRVASAIDHDHIEWWKKASGDRFDLEEL
jgi:hypothetical protein